LCFPKRGKNNIENKVVVRGTVGCDRVIFPLFVFDVAKLVDKSQSSPCMGVPSDFLFEYGKGHSDGLKNESAIDGKVCAINEEYQSTKKIKRWVLHIFVVGIPVQRPIIDIMQYWGILFGRWGEWVIVVKQKIVRLHENVIHEKRIHLF
jgi:hypothetical protein